MPFGAYYRVKGYAVAHEYKPNTHARCVILQQTDSLPESDSSKPDALSAELEAQVK